MSNAAVAFPDVQLVQIALTDPSPFNPPSRLDDIGELIESIKQHGVLEPIMVRPRGERFEVVFGGRRFQASTVAGLESVPAIVRDLTDAETQEIQLVENINRKGVHPLEEAEGFRRLRDEHKYSVDEIAAKIGKSRRYVYARMQLLSLPEDAKKACLGGKLNHSVALYVARIPVPELQADALREILEPAAGEDPLSARDAADLIARKYMLDLGKAQFDRSECRACPKRAGNDPEAYPDVDADVCTDPKCYAGKREKHWVELVSESAAKGFDVASETLTKKIYPSEYQVSPSGDFVDLSEKPIADTKGRTWRKLLGKELPRVTVARDGQGNVHELVSAKTAYETMRKAGHEWAQPATGEDKAAAKKERALERKIQQLLIEKTVAAAAKKLDVPSLLLFLTLEVFSTNADAIEKRRGWSEGSFETTIEKLQPNELGALILEECILDSMPHACEVVGVDFKAVEREAKEVLAAEGKAAEKKVAAKAPKPERPIVAKQPKVKTEKKPAKKAAAKKPAKAKKKGKGK
jgi:ParB/RepB/Spo0J family partition protein